MTFTEVRDCVISSLVSHIEHPVVLSDESTPMPDFPYGYYSVLAPRMSNHYFGLHEILETPEGYAERRSEPVKATMSFTFCSQNRKGKHGRYIYGDDEAMELAEKAHGFFLLAGHSIATESGTVVVNAVGAVRPRSAFLVEETVRRYGFDIRFSYTRTDEMPIEIVENVKFDGKSIN